MKNFFVSLTKPFITHHILSCNTSNMAVDVSYLVRMMNKFKEENLAIESSDGEDKSRDTITRDFLGGGSCATHESTELDLDMQVPTGWEKRLDLKSGKVYLQKCDSQNKHQFNGSFPNLQSFNFLSSSKPPLSLFDEPSTDLKLVSPSPPNYQSVCTLDKVKSALERAERDTNYKKRSVSFSKSSSPAYSNSSSSVREMEMETDYENKPLSLSFAAGCPNCLNYVLVLRSNPKCPRCQTIVPSPVTVKKPRFDLNI